MLAIRRTRRIRGPPPAFVRRAKFRMFLSPISSWMIEPSLDHHRSQGQQFTKSGFRPDSTTRSRCSMAAGRCSSGDAHAQRVPLGPSPRSGRDDGAPASF